MLQCRLPCRCVVVERETENGQFVRGVPFTKSPQTRKLLLARSTPARPEMHNRVSAVKVLERGVAAVGAPEGQHRGIADCRDGRDLRANLRQRHFAACRIVRRHRHAHDRARQGIDESAIGLGVDRDRQIVLASRHSTDAE